jgi:putative CocE/NonD family hydrolase
MMAKKKKAAAGALYRMKQERDVYVTMRDGVQIALRIYRPDAPGRFPALLAASPYQYDTDDLPHSALFLWHEVGPVEWYVREHGYAYVHADIRGTGHSGGAFAMLCKDEQQDLYEVIEWIGRQEWCNGNVGGIGQSYYAWSQWFMGIANPPSLKCIAPYDGCTDPYRDAAYHGGIYSEFLVWWYNMVRANTLPRAAGRPTSRAMARDLTAELIAHQTYDDWWKERCAQERVAEIKVPVFSIGHWGKMGLHLRGNLLGYEAATAPKKLLVTGYRDVFEVHAAFDDPEFHKRELLPFYDRYLKNAKTGYESLPPVRVHVRGRETLRDLPDWPPEKPEMRVLHLGAGPSKSVTSLNDGALAAKPSRTPSSTRFRYPDPQWKFGVAAMGPHGPDPVRRVLTFTTAPLAEDLEVIGPVMLELQVASTNTDTDFFVRVADQFPQPADERAQGRQPASVVVTKGWLRASHREKDDAKSRPNRPWYTHANPQPIEPGKIYKYEIELMPCAYLFKQGHRIRLEIVNGDSALTETPFFVHQYQWYKVGVDTIHHDAAHPSRLLLPLAPPA